MLEAGWCGSILDQDLATLDAHDPRRAMDRMLSRLDTSLETWSTALPLTAVSLLAPLTLHLAFAVLILGLLKE